MPNPPDADEVLEEFEKRKKSAMAAVSKWRDEAKESREFYDGHQWEKDDEEQRDYDKRPSIVFNRVAGQIDAVAGAMAQTALETKYLPRTVTANPRQRGDDDSEPVDLANDAIRYFRDLCDAEYEEKQMFLENLQTGRGCTNTRLDFENDPDGAIVIENVDPFDVFVDPLAKAGNFADADYVFACAVYSKAKLEARWPGSWDNVAESVKTGEERMPEAMAREHDAGRDEYRFSAEDLGDEALIEKESARIYEYQFRTLARFYRWADPATQEIMEIEEEKYRAYVDKTAEMRKAYSAEPVPPGPAEHPAPVPPAPMTDPVTGTAVLPPAPEAVAEFQIAAQAHERMMAAHMDHARRGAELADLTTRLGQAVPFTRFVYWQAFIAGKEFLEKPRPLATKTDFSYQFVTGKYDRTEKLQYGIVRSMKDPQRWANKAISEIVDILRANPKGGVMMESDAVKNVQEFEASHARHDAIDWVNPGAIMQGKIQNKPPPPVIPQLSQLLQASTAAVSEVSGVNPAMQGNAGANTPVGTVQRYLTAGVAKQDIFFASMHRYRKRQGRISLELMRLLPPRKIRRIVGYDSNAWLDFQSDAMAPKYDIVVEEAATAPNRQSENWQAWQLLMPQFAQLGVPFQLVAPHVIEAMPFGMDIKRALVNALAQAQNPQAATQAPNPAAMNAARQMPAGMAPMPGPPGQPPQIQ